MIKTVTCVTVLLFLIVLRRRHLFRFSAFYTPALKPAPAALSRFQSGVRRRLASAKWVYLPKASITTSATGLPLNTVRHCAVSCRIGESGLG